MFKPQPWLILVLLLPLTFAPLAWAEPVDWTLMIYMAADNDLEQAALIDLDEIEAGMPEANVEVLVFIDRAEGYSEDLGNWTDAKILRMRPDSVRGEVHAQVLLELGEVNTGDPANLTKFINYSRSNYPAQHYGLVLWDHGGGWQGMADDEQPGNGSEHDNLTLTEVSDALRASIDPRHPLDLIGFDMCLMAQLEVGYEVAPYARFMVASQAVEPGYGWPYDALLPEFGEALAPKQLAQNIVRKYASFTDDKSERIATQSAFDLSKLEAVRSNLDALTDKLAQVSEQQWPGLSRALFWGDSFETGGKAANLRQGERALASSDLLDVMKRGQVALGRAFPAKSQLHQLTKSIEAAVIDNHVSLRHRLSHGLSIYAPPASKTFNKEYFASRFAKASRWDDYLQLLHGKQQTNKDAPRITSINYVRGGTNQKVDQGSMLDGTTLKLTVEGNHLLWVSGLFGRQDAKLNGHVIYAEQYLFDSRFMQEKLGKSGAAADLLIPEFKGRRAELEMETSPASFAITNGSTSAFATLDITSAQLGQDNTASIQAMVKREGAGEHRAVITFDLMSWQATNVVLLIEQKDGRLVPRGLEPKPADQITLLYKFVEAGKQNSSLVRGAVMPWQQGLELIMDEVPKGRYTAWAIAENLSGETHVASTSITTIEANRDVQAGFAGAKKLSIDNLQGSWSSADGSTTFSIGKRLEPKSEFAQLIVNTQELPAAARNYTFLIKLDTRLLPTLHLLVLDQNKKLQGREVFMLLANPQQPNRLWVKTLLGGDGNALGEIVEVVRTQGLDQNNTTNNPLETLVGEWQGQSDEGSIWIRLLPNGTFQQVETPYDQSGRSESWGRYRFDGGLMRVQFEGGRHCDNWGCEAWYPDPLDPFPLQIGKNQLGTPWATFQRQR